MANSSRSPSRTSPMKKRSGSPGRCELLLHFVLLELVAREDRDAARAPMLEQRLDKAPPERAGAARHQQRGIVEYTHCLLQAVREGLLHAVAAWRPLRANAGGRTVEKRDGGAERHSRTSEATGAIRRKCRIRLGDEG